MAENINMQAKRTNEMETYDFIEGKDKFEDAWKSPGIPAVAPTSDYLGKYLLFGPSKPIGFEKESNQAIEVNFTGPSGTASELYYTLMFALLKSEFNVTKVDEWIEVSPTHREYFDRTISTKGALEASIKEGLRSAAQAVADYELVKHDLRKYKDFMDYLEKIEKAKKMTDRLKKRAELAKAEHELKAMFIDQVDVHTGPQALVEMARTRWPTIISDFMRLTEEDADVGQILDFFQKEVSHPISRAEAVILKTKNGLFRQWLNSFGENVKERFVMLNELVQGRKKSIDEYREWLKPYIARYQALRVGGERKEVRKQMWRSFADLTGQSTFSNTIRIWAWQPFRVVEYRKLAPARMGGLGNSFKHFVYNPADNFTMSTFILDQKKGLPALYPWLLKEVKFKDEEARAYGRAKGFEAERMVYKILGKWDKGDLAPQRIDPQDIYYDFIDITVDRVGVRLPTGELEDITF